LCAKQFIEVKKSKITWFFGKPLGFPWKLSGFPKTKRDLSFHMPYLSRDLSSCNEARQRPPASKHAPSRPATAGRPTPKHAATRCPVPKHAPARRPSAVRRPDAGRRRPSVQQHKTNPPSAVAGSRAAPFTRSSIFVDFVRYIRNIDRFTTISFNFQKKFYQIFKFKFKPIFNRYFWFSWKSLKPVATGFWVPINIYRYMPVKTFHVAVCPQFIQSI
jgi:hypothetical protein